MKPNIFIAITALICHLTVCFNEEGVHSGIKFSLKTNYANLLESFDFNSLISNKPLLEKPLSEGNFLYTVSLNSLKIDKIVSPHKVIVENSENRKTTKVILNGMAAALTASFEARLGLKKFKYNNIPIQVYVTSVICEYEFINGKINLKYFNYSIQNINIKFPDILTDVLYGLSKNIIMIVIEKQGKLLEKKLGDLINNFINQSTVLQAPMGTQLFFDATSTTAPQLFFPSNSNTNDAFLRFGIKGRIFTGKDDKDNLPAPEEMNFIEKYNDKGVSMLVSEYTINTLLDLIQKTGKFSQKFSGSNGLDGIEINSVTLQLLIPELSIYTETKDCSVDISIPMLNYPQPIAYVNEANSTIDIDVTFQFKLDVQEDPDPFEDAVTVLLTEQEVFLKLIPSVFDNKLSFRVASHFLKSLTIKKTTLTNFAEKLFQERFDKFLEIFFKQVGEKMSGLDFNSIISGLFKLPFVMKDLELDYVTRGIAVSFDVGKK